jgi:hypothetical protein
MKALKSERAKTLLADPSARGQLRTYLASRLSASGQVSNSVVIEVNRTSGQVLRVRPEVVPKAA